MVSIDMSVQDWHRTGILRKKEAGLDGKKGSNIEGKHRNKRKAVRRQQRQLSPYPGPERRRVIKEQRCKNKGKNILRAEKRKGLCMGFAAGLTAAALLGREMPADRAQARETQPAIGGMSVRDEDMRKLLIRTGAVYEASGPVFVEIPWELIRAEENLQVEVMAGKNGQEARYRLAFSCTGENPDSP